MVKNEIKLYVEKTAREKIGKLILSKKSDDVFFRIYIIGGGCSGFQYGFDIDIKKENDYGRMISTIVIKE